MKRATLNLSAINKLTDSFIANNNFKLPICILLRTLVADAIIAVYLVDLDNHNPDSPSDVDMKKYQGEIVAGKIMFSDDEIKRFDKRYALLNREALNKMEKQLDKLLIAQVIDSEKRKEIVKGWQNKFPDCFENNGKIRNNKESGVELKVKGISNPHGKEFARRIYWHYFLLSQYEQFSEVTLKMNKQDAISDDITQMTDCLWFILLGVSTISTYLNQTTNDLDEIRKQTSVLFESLYSPTTPLPHSNVKNS